MRKIEKLNKNWRFYHGEFNDAFYKDFEDAYWRKVTIPHDWSVDYPFDKNNSSGSGYLEGGVAWYRLHFDLPENIKEKTILINFGGVYQNSKVWCNSNYLGQRPYGYSSFSYDITDFAVSGENVIAVRAEHLETADSRWFTGNGIYRDVTITTVDKNHFEEQGIFASTVSANENEALIDVAWQANTNAKIDFELANPTGEIVAKASAKGENGTCEINVKKPILWSDEKPYLYKLISKLIVGEKTCDILTTQIGIRTIKFDADKGFFLNGNSTKLKGICIHHDAGALGSAVPKSVWKKRLEQLKSCGANALRTAHNPPSSDVLDLCDELGFLVMDEAFDEWEGCKNKWWQGHNVYPPKHYGYASQFPMWHEKDLTDMVLRDRNHPSIIMWSIGNEIDYPNDPYVHPFFEEVAGNNDKNKPKEEMIYNPNKPNAERLAQISTNLSNIVKKHDITRPVTSAISFPELSNLTGYSQSLDVIGYNYKEQFYESDHKKYPNHIIYGSENGKTAEAWFAVTENDYICGQFLWTGFDFLGEAKGWPIRNSEAGLIDIAGTEKPIYYHRKALWSNEKFAKLSTELDETETFSWNYEEKEKVKVNCYSNCKNVELFLNGVSQGNKNIDKFCTATWEIEFEKGEIFVESYGEILDKLASHEKPVKFDAKQSKKNLKADGEEMMQICYTLKDENDIDVYNEDVKMNFAIIGDAQIVGIENGNAADLTPYSEKFRNTYHGKIVVFIRAGESCENIELVAFSKDIETKRILIKQGS